MPGNPALNGTSVHGHRGSLVIVERSPLFVEGVRSALRGIAREVLPCSPHIERLRATLRTGEASSGCIVLIGPHVLTREAFALCRWVRTSPHPAPVILISAHAADPIYQADALDMGASAMLTVDVTASELLATLDVVRANTAIVPHQAARAALTELSERELQVLRLIATGKSDPVIAAELGLSTATVRKHSQHAIEKLCVHSRQDAVERARHRGWI
jgi:DNA-binding NarL/FixJ family response regulator